jgi:hypothetical protein
LWGKKNFKDMALEAPTNPLFHHLTEYSDLLSPCLPVWLVGHKHKVLVRVEREALFLLQKKITPGGMLKAFLSRRKSSKLG